MVNQGQPLFFLNISLSNHTIPKSANSFNQISKIHLRRALPKLPTPNSKLSTKNSKLKTPSARHTTYDIRYTSDEPVAFFLSFSLFFPGCVLSSCGVSQCCLRSHSMYRCSTTFGTSLASKSDVEVSSITDSTFSSFAMSGSS